MYIYVDKYEFSGYAVSLSSDGSIVAIGAEGNDGNGANQGHVSVYYLSALLSINSNIFLDFNLYPNPAKDQFTIELDNTLEL